jgi:SAM-dependent methyltransferase
VGRPQEIADRFAALAPWTTRWVIDGECYGGDLDYSRDIRVATFFEWFGSPRTILELSSFEGVHTLQLSAEVTTERVLGLEGRSDNVERARLVAELAGQDNVEFAVENLETVDLAPYGRFDAVFCGGLLYHLVAPWRLLAEVARVSDRLFLDTHYWPWPATAEVEGYRGGWVDEGGSGDALSGLSSRSLWLNRPSLLEALTNAGWAVRQLLDHPGWRHGPRLWLGCVRPGSVPPGATAIGQS